MFDVLVESTSQRRGAKMWAYFAASSVVWIGILAATAVAGVMTYDARLDAEFDNIGLIAYVPDTAPPKMRETERRPETAAPEPNRFVSHAEAPATIAPPRPVLPSTGPSTAGLPIGSNTGMDGGIPDSTGTLPPGLLGHPGTGPATARAEEPPQPPPDPDPAPVERPSRPISKGPLNGIATHKVTPPFPEMARRANVAAEVVVTVTVSEQGAVTSAKVLRGHPLLNDAAVRAAYGWRFTPTTLGGVPVKVVGTITFNFKRS
jgi:TonB family protein